MICRTILCHTAWYSKKCNLIYPCVQLCLHILVVDWDLNWGRMPTCFDGKFVSHFAIFSEGDLQGGSNSITPTPDFRKFT